MSNGAVDAAAACLKVGCQNGTMGQDGPQGGPPSTAAPAQARGSLSLPLPQTHSLSLVLHCSGQGLEEGAPLWVQGQELAGCPRAHISEEASSLDCAPHSHPHPCSSYWHTGSREGSAALEQHHSSPWGWQERKLASHPPSGPPGTPHATPCTHAGLSQCSNVHLGTFCTFMDSS
jgi:hypothetical protein